MAQSLGEMKVFPTMVVQMIAVGESTGAMDTMLNKIADFYDDEVDDAIGTMMSLLEPAIMAFLAVLLGGLVISMYLPVFSMAVRSAPNPRFKNGLGSARRLLCSDACRGFWFSERSSRRFC